jgi:hypothetical protein
VEHVEKADHASTSGTAETTTSELMSKDDEESSRLQQKKKEQADATSGQGDKAGQDYAEAEDGTGAECIQSWLAIGIKPKRH